MDRRKAIRYLAYSLELIVLFILQETPGLMFSLWGERPSFLFLCMIAIAQFESEIPAMAFGVFGGLLLDYGMGGVMGMHALIMGVLCYIISSFSRNLLRNNVLTAFLVSIGALALVFVCDWVFDYVLVYEQYHVYALTHHYLPRYGITVIWTPVTYFFNRAFFMRLRSAQD